MIVGWQHINRPGLLQTGDVGHLHGRSEIIGPGIRLFSTHTGEDPTFSNHAFHVHTEAMYNARGQLRKGVEIIEAEADRVNINMLAHYENRADIVITRPRPLTRIEKQIIQSTGLSYYHLRYPYLKIALHAIQRLIKPSGQSIIKLAFRRNPYCNMLTQLCYERIGISFGLSPDVSTPDDLLDWSIRHGHEIVWASTPEAVLLLRESYPRSVLPEL